MLCEIKLFQITATYVSHRHTHTTQQTNIPTLCFSFGITNSAYRSLQDQNESQCMCILGENGSGKTESARIILHFLSNVHSQHTLSGKKIFHNQNSTRLMRCKSLAAYPKYESPEAPCRSGRRDSIKFQKLHVNQLANRLIVAMLMLYFFFHSEINRNR